MMKLTLVCLFASILISSSFAQLDGLLGGGSGASGGVLGGLLGGGSGSTGPLAGLVNQAGQTVTGLEHTVSELLGSTCPQPLKTGTCQLLIPVLADLSGVVANTFCAATDLINVLLGCNGAQSCCAQLNYCFETCGNSYNSCMAEYSKCMTTPVKPGGIGVLTQNSSLSNVLCPIAKTIEEILVNLPIISCFVYTNEQMRGCDCFPNAATPGGAPGGNGPAGGNTGGGTQPTVPVGGTQPAGGAPTAPGVPPLGK